jgi:hypothetical protein
VPKELREKASKKYEAVPKFLDQIGQSCPEVHPNMIKFTRDLTGGLIS